jgi:hypothetical protein
MRAKDQEMVGCWCSTEFVEKIDTAKGPRTRSQFCRDALYEKLLALGIEVDEAESYPPDRTGKGGPRYKIKPAGSVCLNDKPNLKPESAPERAARIAAARARAASQARKRKPPTDEPNAGKS